MKLLIVGVLIVCASGPALAVSYTFTNLNPAMIGSGPAIAGGQNDVPFSILNSTGVTWTDFHMQIDHGPAGTQGLAMFIPSNLASIFGTDGQTYEGPGSYSLSSTNNPIAYPDTINMLGLNIANSGTFVFTLDIAAGESGWIIAGYPTTTTGPTGTVPEPASLLLLGTGLGVLGLAAWRRKKT